MISTGKDAFSPPIVIQPESISSKTSKGRKHVVAAIASVLIVLIVVAGFVSAFFYMHKTSSAVLQNVDLAYMDQGKKVSETADVFSSFIYKYHVMRSESPVFSIIEDYSRRIVVIREESEKSLPCMVLHMSDSYDGVKKSGSSNVTEMPIQMGKHEILGRDILSSEGKDMCDGSELYWGVTAKPNEENKVHRMKRSCIRCRIVCELTCYEYLCPMTAPYWRVQVCGSHCFRPCRTECDWSACPTY